MHRKALIVASATTRSQIDKELSQIHQTQINPVGYPQVTTCIFLAQAFGWKLKVSLLRMNDQHCLAVQILAFDNSL